MNYRQVTEEERYMICTWVREGKTKTFIANTLHRSRSTIQREIRRNRDALGYYKPMIAHQIAVTRRRSSRRVTYFSESDWKLVHSKIKIQWAPEQISLRLGEEGKLRMHFSTIYRHIKKEKLKGRRLHKHLRQYHKKRRKGYGHPDSRGVLRGKRNIRRRPKAATKRLEWGHFEVDLMRGYKGAGYIMTLADRMTRYTRIIKLRNKTAYEVATKLIPLVRELKIKTFTADNGCEFHDYDIVEAQTDVRFYFANPHRSWERGTIENINGLIRQYLPKEKPFTRVTQNQCDFITQRLNQRPRKIIKLRTPEEYYYEVAA